MAKIRRGREHQPHAQRALLAEATRVEEVTTPETDDEIARKLNERFNIIAVLTDAACKGTTRAFIASGPPGIGKSHTIFKVLNEWDPNHLNHTIVKGYVKATGLYKLLYQYREAGQVIVLDDADSVFFEDTALNLLKTACDTCDTRIVHYLAEGGLVDEETGAKIPREFEFSGTIIFATNLDFEKLVAKGHKLAEHMRALMSRAHYIDCAMHTRRDYMVRIRQVMAEGLLKGRGLTDTQEREVIDFIETNADSLRELSLRVAIKLADIRQMNTPDWRAVARVTCCR